MKKLSIIIFLVFACSVLGQTTATLDTLRQKAEQGDADAQYNLGIMYIAGDGIKRDENEAKIWLEKSAAQGHVEAARLLKSLQP